MSVFDVAVFAVAVVGVIFMSAVLRAFAIAYCIRCVTGKWPHETEENEELFRRAIGSRR